MPSANGRSSIDRSTLGLLTILALTTILAIVAAPATCDDSVLANTLYGQIRGSANKTAGFTQFLGVPFAQPPLGQLRWHEPVAPHRWSGVRDATSYRAACYQSSELAMGKFKVHLNVSEDCLYLNVFVPTSNSTAPLPVLVFVHGGAFTSGSAYSYTAGELSVKTRAIVVTLEYRVNVFGFFLLPNRAHHNFGLLDISMGFQWVNQNIHYFGGDPTRVTAGGASAGALAIAIMTTQTPLYFSQIILESPALWNLATTTSLGVISGTHSATKGCIGFPDYVLQCMRSLSAEEVLQAPASIIDALFIPAFGGSDIPVPPLRLFKQGHFKKMPMIVGNSQYEGNLFMLLFLNLTETSTMGFLEYDAAIALVAGVFGTDAISLGLEYAADAQSLGYFRALSKLLADALTFCPADSLARTYFSSPVNSTAYRYYFTHTPTYSYVPYLHATHGTEIPFVFNSPQVDQLGQILTGDRFSSHEQQLADTFASRYGAFVHTGNPGAGWPGFNSATNQVMEWKTPVSATTTLPSETVKHCKYWSHVLERD